MSDKPPQLPNQLSPDGSEIWDWGHNMSKYIHRQAQIQEITDKIRKCGTVCGDCHKWMKSSECPREKNVNGWNKGPSMSSPICDEFVETPWVTEWRTKLQAQWNELKSQK